MFREGSLPVAAKGWLPFRGRGSLYFWLPSSGAGAVLCTATRGCELLTGSGSLYSAYFVPVLLAAMAFCRAGKDIVLFRNCRGSWWLPKKGTDALRFNAFSGPRRDPGSASTDFQKELPSYACSAFSVLRTS